MGVFYTSVVLRGVGLDSALDHLERSGSAAEALRLANDLVLVCDPGLECQHPGLLATTGAGLSAALACVALVVLNHDDDELAYWLYERGELRDRYRSNPGAFAAGPRPAEGGSARAMCAAFECPQAVERVAALLHPRPGEGPPCATALHLALAEALGLPRAAVDPGCLGDDAAMLLDADQPAVEPLPE